MLIKDLKFKHPKIYNRVLELQSSNGNSYNDDLHIGTNALEGNFDWHLTAEGFDVWCKISDGNMKDWYYYWKMKNPAEEDSPQPVKVDEDSNLFWYVLIGIAAVDLVTTAFLIYKVMTG